MTGYGQMSWPSGAAYEGQYLNGEKHGPGVYTWPDGSMLSLGIPSQVLIGALYRGRVYEGQWSHGEMHGKGVLYGTDGNVVSGVWCHGKSP
eukprot:g11918.t1